MRSSNSMRSYTCRCLNQRNPVLQRRRRRGSPMAGKYAQPLPVVRVAELPCEGNAQRWLVEHLWGAASVGVIGGAPKCSKTWLGLDMALSVATGTACLGKFA